MELISEGDRVIVRKRWTDREAAIGNKIEFSEIDIRPIANHQFDER